MRTKSTYIFLLTAFCSFYSVSAKQKEKETTTELSKQYSDLEKNLKERKRMESYKSETFNTSSLILPSDRDPLNIVLRRTKTLLNDLSSGKVAEKVKPFTEELEKLAKLAESIKIEDKEKRHSLYEQVCELRRKIAFSNPLLDFDKILFIKRHWAGYKHMCDQYYGINARPGGALCVLSDPFGDTPKVKNLLNESVVESGRMKGEKLEGGSFLSPDLSFDGKKILFAYVECKGERKQDIHTEHKKKGHWNKGRSYHIFSVNSDGSQLKQITEGTWNDFDPVFLPNERIAFITERRGGYLRCGRACPTFTLFDMAEDGTDIRTLSPHETNEWHPSVTNDGMIIFTRWDYVDRHGCTAHHPWITYPDGRDPRAIHGNFSPRKKRADMEVSIRSIPGSHKYVSVAAPHHGQSFGSLIIIDRRVEDDDLMAPVKRLTPDVGFPETQVRRSANGYATPWALSEKYYLSVYAKGLYLVDVFGNKELIYRDPSIPSQSPIPFRARNKPPVIPDGSKRVVKGKKAEGTLAVLNVYNTLRKWDEKIKIKALRVYQIIPMSVPSGRPPHEISLREPTSKDSVVLARYVLGTVPVEEDGSAFFKAPADKELFFQSLDKDGLAVTSMRSATHVKNGENLVCLGCHEPKKRAPEPIVPMAMKREPSELKPDVDGTNPFSYPRLVQPVLDKICLGCHQKNKGKAPRLDREVIKKGRNKWFASYHSLAPKYGFWSYGEPLRTIPGKFGARHSKLYKMLKEGHKGVKLTPEDMHRITVWLDSCSVFYGVYEKEGGEAQLRGEIVKPTLE